MTAPPSGRMRPAPGLRFIPATPPREGSGDMRHPTALLPGTGPWPDTGSRWHNPSREQLPADHRNPAAEAVWVNIRNGLPVRPYAHRLDGWQQRAAGHGLNLAAIEAADAELDAAEREWRHAAARRRGPS